MAAVQVSDGRRPPVPADSPLLIDANGDARAITDDRAAHLSDSSVERVRNARNRPGAFYVAATATEGACKSVRDTTSLRRSALLCDGTARLVERVKLVDWQEHREILVAFGPEELVRARRKSSAVRSAPNGPPDEANDTTRRPPVPITHLARP